MDGVLKVGKLSTIIRLYCSKLTMEGHNQTRA